MWVGLVRATRIGQEGEKLQENLSSMCAGVNEIGHRCLLEQLGLVKSVCESGGLAKSSKNQVELVNSVCSSEWDWSRGSAEASGIGQESLLEQAGLVKHICCSGCDWSELL